MRKRIVLVAMMTAFGMVGTTISANADAEMGQKIYKKKLRKACKVSGVRFAQNHTQDEWQEINSAGKLPEEVKKICPSLDLEQIKGEWWPSLYDFFYEYGEGSSHVPKC